jgi:hypothetical protein
MPCRSLTPQSSPLVSIRGRIHFTWQVSMHEEGSCCARKVAREPWSRDGTYRSNLNRPEGCKCQNSPCTDCEVFRFSKLNTVCPPTLNGRSSRSGANERGVSGWMIARSCRIDGRTTRSFGQLRRFHHVINPDKVIGTHNVEHSPVSLSLTDVFMC